MLQYVVKPCVRGFGEIPTDQEFDNGEMTLVLDDCNPGTSCCLPGYYKRLTVTAKVRAVTTMDICHFAVQACQWHC